MDNTIYRLKHIVIILLLFCSSIRSQVPIQKINDALQLVSFEYKRDQNKNYTKKNIQQAPFTIVEERDRNWGSKNGSYWFKIVLDNTKEKTDFIFRLPSVHVKDFKVYHLQNKELLLVGISGNNIPISDKATIARYAAIPYQIDTGRSVFYMQVFFKQEAHFPLEILSEKQFDRIVFNFLSLSGGYYGFAILILILSLGMFFYFKDPIYLYYGLFLGIITLSLFYDDGFFSCFFPSLIHYYDLIEITLHWLGAITATVFCCAFLNIKNELPWIGRWLWILIVIAGVFYISGYYRDDFYHYRTAGYVVYVVFLATWLVSCYIATYKKYARILVFAYLLVLFSSMGHYILRVAGYQFINISSNEIKLGGVIEMLILGGAILYRFKFLQKENEVARAQLDIYLNRLQETTKNKKISLHESVIKLSTEYNLSKRETEVLSELSKGYSNKQIADALHISIPTVKFHTSNIYEKLEVSNRFEVIEKIT